MSHRPERSREEGCRLLGSLPAEDVVALADEVLATGASVRVTRRPETGSIVLQVREPVARHRFQLADLLVTTAELELDGEPGWAMRAGDDRHAALAQAVCEAELARNGSVADRIATRLDAEEKRLVDGRADQWQQLLPTVVEFEEVL